MAWGPSSGGNAAGYRVYYGGASRNYTNMIDVHNVTNATIGQLLEGATYYFAITTYDAVGLESDFSTEIACCIPKVALSLKIRIDTSGTVWLSGAGESGHPYEIQEAGDVSSWKAIGSVTAGADGSFEYPLAVATGASARFYRVRDLLP